MLRIVLLTHNRPQQALEAIESILEQTDRRFQLVVSDNSDSDQLRHLLGNQQEIIYTRRSQTLSAIDHGNVVLAEIANTDSCEYFTLFHDDDLMLPAYVENFWWTQSYFPDAVAFGTNAQFELFKKPAGLSFRAAGNYVGPISPDNLLRRYFSHHQLGIAPLPSYIYKKNALNDLRFNVTGGKYSDVQWLSQWASQGDLIWINEPMMVYRLHETNDGSYESRQDRLKFLAFLKHKTRTFSPEILSDYRNFLYKKILLSSKARGHNHGYQLFLRFLQTHRCRRIFRISFYRSLINKTWTKVYLGINRKTSR